MLPNSTTLKSFFFFFHLREKREKPQECLRWGGVGRKKAPVTSQDSVFYFGRRRCRMSTSSSSTRSSPRDQHLIGGWTTGQDPQCGRLPLECHTRVFPPKQPRLCPAGQVQTWPEAGIGGGGGSWSSYQRNTSARTACPFASAQWNSCLTLRRLCLGHTVVTVTSATRGWGEVLLSHQQILC